MNAPPTPAELAQIAISDADEISERIIKGKYRASISDVERLRNHVRKLAKAATEPHVIGHPHVEGIEVGDTVEAKVWQTATVTWCGDFICYVTTPDGRKHKVERFASHMRIPE